MDSLLAPLLSYLLLYKYVTLFAMVYLSAVILPLPSNAMLLAVGAFASQGYFSFWLSLALAVVANTLGDLTDYVVARKYSHLVIRWLKLEKFVFFVQLKKELVSDAAVTVFITRFAGLLSTIGNFLAGIVGVPWKTFLWSDFWGNAIEPFAALGLGYVAGNYWSDFSGPLSLIAGIIGVAVILFVLERIRRRMIKRYSSLKE